MNLNEKIKEDLMIHKLEIVLTRQQNKIMADFIRIEAVSRPYSPLKLGKSITFGEKTDETDIIELIKDTLENLYC